MKSFFITGMARSGTTFLDKLLGSHPQLGVLSQPFPFLFRNIKSAFFEEINYPSTDYILNDLFLERHYLRADFRMFLEAYEIDRPFLNQVFKEMEGWSGQLTKIDFLNIKLDQNRSQLSDVYKDVISQTNVSMRKVSNYIGAKEILAEEFIEYFSSKGIKCLVIIRDPRDVITSLNVGSGTKYGGNIRPTLFHLRNWRKSVAISNTFAQNPNFLAVKYEDLILNRSLILERITDFLEVKPFSVHHFDSGIRQSDGTIWEGNSSTTDKMKLDTNNYNKYRGYLDRETITYIENICFPEMKALGYGFESSDSLNLERLSQFKEQFKVDVDNLDINMSSNVIELEKEKQRLDLLKRDAFKKEIQECFYSIENYIKLKAAVSK